MKKAKQILLTLIICLLLCLTVAASDDIVYNFENEQSMTGWSTQYMRYNFDPGYFNGYAYEYASSLSDPFFMSPTLNINAEDYRYVILTMKYSLDATWSRSGTVFFMLPGGTWNQAHSVNSGAYASTEVYDFVDIVFDMTKNQEWKGQIKQIRVDPFDVPGSVCVKAIKLTNTLPEVKVEEKPEEQAKKEIGVFLKVNSYNNIFTDVENTAWYAKEVAGAYELGLINGKTATLFSPKDGMTVAEAITLGARLNNAYGTADYEFKANDTEPWYTPYVNYAIDKGIIKADTFSEYDRRITRGEMALVFANVLPSNEYNYINSVSTIPDVPQSSPYYSCVYKLYNSGIVVGNDGYGTFYPDSEITRAEASAIINRVASKELRISKNLLVQDPTIDNSAFTMSSEAKFLMDDEKFNHTSIGGVAGGWDVVKYYDAPVKEKRPSNILEDTSQQHEGYFSRQLFDVSDGVLDFEFGARIYGNDGVYVAFVDDVGSPIVQVMLQDGKYKVLTDNGAYADTGVKYISSSVYFDLHINLDKDTLDLCLDGAYAGTYSFAKGKTISAFRYGTTKEATATITADYAVLTHNYLELERFNNAPNNVLPYSVSVINDGGKVEKVMLNSKYANGGTVALNSDAGRKTGISGTFEKASGNVVFETYVLLPTELDGAKIALKNGNTEVFSLTTKDGNFVSPNGSTVKYVTKNLWHIVRFEADTTTGKALVKINGKNAGTYDFSSKSDVIDGYEITYMPKVDAKMYVDDITAFIKLPYPEDYVPEPVIPESDYLIGMNVCSLWREGAKHGWDEITAYPELTSVLGYYDEGSPETSDWEIKMMTEHGIDYQIFCWYPDGNITSPIQHTMLNKSIIDGYFNARYSNKMKFAIMWENFNVSSMTFEDFKNYTVPYWIEYFFKDDRYQKIDNKPLLTLWEIDGKFGDCTAKEAFDYLRSECEKAGFDGCEILLYSTNLDQSYKAQLDSLGIDGILAYHWGKQGADADNQAANIEKYSALDYTIPTISVGFDYVGWGFSNQRNGLLDPKDYPRLCDIVKDALAKRQANGSKYANMVNISNWNEYGEGTYVMPTERFGFAYLDAIRENFTKADVAHDDVTTLSQSQRQRINYLFDQDRQLLRPQLLKEKQEEEVKDPFEDAVVVSKITFADKKAEDFTAYGNVEIKDSNLHLIPLDKDPAVMFKNSLSPVISTKEVNAIRIRAKVTGDSQSSMTVFYALDDGKGFDGAKSISTANVTGEWHDYCFDLRAKENWKGNLVNLRIDPAEYKFELAEIESIEFIKLPDLVVYDPYTIDVNGIALSFTEEPTAFGETVMAPFYPESGVTSSLKSIYKWDKYTKTLTVTNITHTVSFVIGTDKATVDGTQVQLKKATYMDDGLPVIPFDVLAEGLGYFPVYHEDNNGLSIMLNSASDYDVIKNRVVGEYEFSIDGDGEGWTAQHGSFKVKDGILMATSTGTDPAISSPNLNLKAELYPTIKVRMKYEITGATKGAASIYFRTSSTGLSDSRRVDISIPASSNGEYVELTFNMSEHIQWFGTITGIRFDPFNAVGTYDIDYIRLEIDKQAVEVARLQEEYENNLTDTITNGDAQIPEFNPMLSSGGSVSIVECVPGSGDYCYDVKAAGGKSWTYMLHKVKFVPGQKYVIEFDARMTSTNTGDTTPGIKTGLYLNIMYNGGKNRDHPIGLGSITITEFMDWTHYRAEFVVGQECDNANDYVGIFTDPIGEGGANYQIDNLTMTRIEE